MEWVLKITSLTGVSKENKENTKSGIVSENVEKASFGDSSTNTTENDKEDNDEELGEFQIFTFNNYLDFLASFSNFGDSLKKRDSKGMLNYCSLSLLSKKTGLFYKLSTTKIKENIQRFVKYTTGGKNFFHILGIGSSSCHICSVVKNMFGEINQSKYNIISDYVVDEFGDLHIQDIFDLYQNNVIKRGFPTVIVSLYVKGHYNKSQEYTKGEYNISSIESFLKVMDNSNHKINAYFFSLPNCEACGGFNESWNRVTSIYKNLNQVSFIHKYYTRAKNDEDLIKEAEISETQGIITKEEMENYGISQFPMIILTKKKKHYKLPSFKENDLLDLISKLLNKDKSVFQQKGGGILTRDTIINYETKNKHLFNILENYLHGYFGK